MVVLTSTNPRMVEEATRELELITNAYQFFAQQEIATGGRSPVEVTARCLKIDENEVMSVVHSAKLDGVAHEITTSTERQDSLGDMTVPSKRRVGRPRKGDDTALLKKVRAIVKSADTDGKPISARYIASKLRENNDGDYHTRTLQRRLKRWGFRDNSGHFFFLRD
mmetsp:Transcript_5352/g.15993  ORF Transcript_5352/g.15993 Transcript_5352/m.15993 type:complete len:166 (-) Transcript_5352:139-636(-)